MKNQAMRHKSWFILVHTSQGGILTATISITNLGLRTFDCGLVVSFYPPEGKDVKFYRDYRRKDISYSGDGFDLKIGANRLRADANAHHLSINEAQFALDLKLKVA